MSGDVISEDALVNLRADSRAFCDMRGASSAFETYFVFTGVFLEKQLAETTLGETYLWDG